MIEIKKKLLFKAKKRGILENELFLIDFATNYALKKYSKKELEQLIDFLDKTDEFTLYEAIFKTTDKIRNKFIDDMIEFKSLKSSFGN